MRGDFVEINGIEGLDKRLGNLLLSRPETLSAVRAIVARGLAAARRTVQKAAAAQIANDPRHASEAVKYVVYKRVLGGNVSLLAKRKRGAPTAYAPTRRLVAGQRGGNRRPVSPKTSQIRSYHGEDRGFILRWLNSGTKDREIAFEEDAHRSSVRRGSQGGDASKYGRTTNTGNRGRITPRNFFSSSSMSAVTAAADKIGKELDEYINVTLNG